MGEASRLNEFVKVDKEVSEYTENLSGKLLFIYFSFSNLI